MPIVPQCALAASLFNCGAGQLVPDGDSTSSGLLHTMLLTPLDNNLLLYQPQPSFPPLQLAVESPVPQLTRGSYVFPTSPSHNCSLSWHWKLLPFAQITLPANVHGSELLVWVKASGFCHTTDT